MYLITSCASCAAPLDGGVKQCSRCKTRYCSAACQRDHWKRGGHKKACEKIAAGGGAEEFYAMEEGAEAIMACFGSPAGAKCYICDRTVVSEVSPDLARGCSCRGKEGFAHVRCLAEQARNAVENKRESRESMWTRWHTCQKCGQQFHGVVRHALGWSCWMTYRELSEGDERRCRALDELGHGLFAVGRYEDALTAFTAAAKGWQAVPKAKKCELQNFLSQSFIAMCCSKLGRKGCAVLTESENKQILNSCYNRIDLDGALGALKRCACATRPTSAITLMFDVSWSSGMWAPDHKYSSIFALRYAVCLLDDASVAKAVEHLIDAIPKAARVLGEDNAIVIELGWRFAQARYLSHFFGHAGFRDDLILSIEGHIDVLGRSSRVLGNHHPTTREIAASLKLCFDEQLDWTLDDDVQKWLYVRRVLDGDFPPDPADLHLRYDEPTLDMVRQRAFLESLNIL